MPLIAAPSPIPLTLISLDGEVPEGVKGRMMPLESTNTASWLECCTLQPYTFHQAAIFKYSVFLSLLWTPKHYGFKPTRPSDSLTFETKALHPFTVKSHQGPTCPEQRQSEKQEQCMFLSLSTLRWFQCVGSAPKFQSEIVSMEIIPKSCYSS